MKFRESAATLGILAMFGTASVEAQRVAPSVPSFPAGAAKPEAAHSKHDQQRIDAMLQTPDASTEVVTYKGRNFLVNTKNLHEISELNEQQLVRYKSENVKIGQVVEGSLLAVELDYMTKLPSPPKGLRIFPGTLRL